MMEFIERKGSKKNRRDLFASRNKTSKFTAKESTQRTGLLLRQLDSTLHQKMNTLEFGVIEEVNLRDVWKHEAHEFTPWLADNIDKLSQAVGLELELIETEASVGGFSLDILARDVGSGSHVIIENQIEKTDHDHLGKLITYAGGYNAKTVIWIASSMREEHRQALDWLNQNTDEGVSFFGIVVKVVKIGESLPALNLNVVVSPNEWQKTHKFAQSRKPSDKASLYQTYFQTLVDELREKHKFTNSKKAQPKNWMSFSSGDNRFNYGHNFSSGNRARTEMYIDSGDEYENINLFDFLYSKKNHIEEVFGSELSWERLEGKRACRIALYKNGQIFDDDNELCVMRKWAVKSLLQFKNTFTDCVNWENTEV